MKKRLQIRFKVMLLACIALFLLCSGMAPREAHAKSNTESIGDFLHVFIPFAALGGTFVAGSPDGRRWDREGTFQLMKTVGFGGLLTQVGKYGTEKLRPDESNERSFPSGHVSLAFSGAGFIDTRYGHVWGAPALLAAAYVGYSRIYADKHHADDALAGASVGLIASWLFSTPQSQSGNAALLPMMFEDGAGLQLSFVTGGNKAISRPRRDPHTKTRRKFRYNFGFGPAYLQKNEITAPEALGTTFDLDTFQKSNDPTTTAAVGFSYYPDERNEILFYYTPFENRDWGEFMNPVSFGGQTFPANTDIRSAWRLYDLRVEWRYDLIPAETWDVNVGAGVLYQNTKVSLNADDGTVASVEDNVVLPLVNGGVRYKFASRWAVGLDAEGIYLSDDYLLDAYAHLSYKITDRWDCSVGYRYYAREIDTDKLKNQVIYSTPYVTIAYSWLTEK